MGNVIPPTAPIPTLPRQAVTAPAAAPGAPLTPFVRPAARDRFVAGMTTGALSGVKSTMYAAIPIAALSLDPVVKVIGKVGPSTSFKAIALLTLAAAGTGAVTGGVTALITDDPTWGTVTGGAMGGLVIGGIRGLMTKSWKGAIAGAVIGGAVGAFAGRQGAKAVAAPTLLAPGR